MKELWKKIPGFERYQVSNLGRLKDLKGEVVSPYLRLCNKRPYPIFVIRKPGLRKCFTFYVHRLVWTLFNGPIPDGLELDHKDRNPLNSSVKNLRLATRTQQMQNRKKSSKANPNYPVRKYKGILYQANIKNPEKKWAAQVIHNRKKYWLGSFPTQEEAAKAYNDMAIKLFGEFAYLNVIPSQVN